MHMVAARSGFERAMVGSGLANPHMDKLIKHHSHLEEGWFLVRKAALAVSGCNDNR